MGLHEDFAAQCSKMSDAELKRTQEELVREISTLDNIQMAAKIFLNSLYGAVGCQWFRYYNTDMAEAVTITGQLVIQGLEEATNECLNKAMGTTGKKFIVAGDTDSMYVALGEVVEHLLPGETDQRKISKWVDEFAKTVIEPTIKRHCEELGDYLNCPQKILAMKRESIANKGIWTAKKRYALNVFNSEGVEYDPPKLKITGLEAIKASTPSACRDFLKKALDIIMNHEEKELIAFVSKTRKGFKKLPFDAIAFPRKVKALKKYQSATNVAEKGCPIAVRGALVYNHLLKQLKLSGKYSQIRAGDIVKFCYLRKPNKFGHHVIAVPSGDELPKEFNMDAVLDFNLQYEKSFLEPLKAVTDCIGWHTERVNSLAAFFE